MPYAQTGDLIDGAVPRGTAANKLSHRGLNEAIRVRGKANGLKQNTGNEDYPGCSPDKFLGKRLLSMAAPSCDLES